MAKRKKSEWRNLELFSHWIVEEKIVWSAYFGTVTSLKNRVMV